MEKKASLYISGALEPSGSCGGGGLFFSSKFALSHLRSFSSKPLHFSLLDLDSQSREDPTGYRSYFLLKVILGGASMFAQQTTHSLRKIHISFACTFDITWAFIAMQKCPRQVWDSIWGHSLKFSQAGKLQRRTRGEEDASVGKVSAM